MEQTIVQAQIPTIKLKAELARRRLLDFVKFCWPKPEPYIVGTHTRAICARIDRALEGYRKGISTFLTIKVPPRHGKSVLVSEYLPAKFLGEFPEADVIVASYAASLAHQFSKASRNHMRGDRYRMVYPEINLSKDEQSVEVWGIDGHGGKANWAGIGGSLTGKGSNLSIMDDPFKGREDAESQVMRNKIWESFTNDLMTRRAPVTIVIVMGTPWHVDDVFGRIKAKMDADDKFPRFEDLKFPAFSDSYPEGILFPERFSPKYYQEQTSLLGTYGTASLLQCEPVLKEGNLLRTDKIKFYKEAPKDVIWVRGWDLASSRKERMSDDPDYTVGNKIGVRWIKSEFLGEAIPEVYFDDMIRGRWEAPQRDAIIKATAIGDGHITQGIEAFGPYKDAYIALARALYGLRTVRKMNLPGDKVSKYAPLEPIFEAGNFHMREAPWKEDAIEELSQVPGSSHDDIADALAVAYALHNPTSPSVFTKLPTNVSTDKNTIDTDYDIEFGNLSQYTTLFASQWVEKNLYTNVIMCLWNSAVGKLYPFAEIQATNPTPETIMKKMMLMLRGCNNGKFLENPDGERKLHGLDMFEWFGNKAMFSVSAMNGDMHAAYSRQGINVRENDNYDEGGSILMVNRLEFAKKLRIHERCGELLRQRDDWAIEENKPAEGYGMARALCNLVSVLHETGKLEEKRPRLPDYSPKKTAFQEEVLAAARGDDDRLERYIVDQQQFEYEMPDSSDWLGSGSPNDERGYGL